MEVQKEEVLLELVLFELVSLQVRFRCIPYSFASLDGDVTYTSQSRASIRMPPIPRLRRKPFGGVMRRVLLLSQRTPCMYHALASLPAMCRFFLFASRDQSRLSLVMYGVCVRVSVPKVASASGGGRQGSDAVVFRAACRRCVVFVACWCWACVGACSCAAHGPRARTFDARAVL